MADTETRGSMLTGLTAGEAQEFHSFFMSSTIVYIVVAIVAHFLVWQWRPWFPGVRGYSWLQDGVTTVTTLIG
jgi:light-harvesting complex 1 beta chain